MTAARVDSSSKPVLDVMRGLLDEGAKEQVLSLVAELVARNEALELALAKKLRAFKTTEKVPPGQLALFLEKVANDEAAGSGNCAEASSPTSGLTEIVADERQRQATETTKPPPRRPSRKPFPESLERVDVTLTVPAGERPCPECSNERRCIGHEITETLELVPAKVVVQRHHREKLVCDACETPHFVRAPRQDRVMEGGLFGSALVGQLLVDKYRDCLPLHRQRERFRRMGVDLAVSTLADQVARGAELLQPLWRALQIAALQAEVFHLDGTSLPFFSQDKGVKKGKKIGALWGYVGDDDVALYLFALSGHATFSDRHTIGLADFLALRAGLTFADAASVFDQAFAQDNIVECDCNMHARRYFVQALDGGDSRAALALDAYQVLYGIEREGCELPPDARLRLRQERSAPIFAKMLEWAASIKDEVPPSSGLGRALTYLTNQSLPLARFLEDGRVPIDNGVVERLHVRAALTRKNFLFAGSERGAQSAAVIYSVLGSCAVCDVEPVEYLREVIPILAGGIVEQDVAKLLPRSLSPRCSRRIQAKPPS